ncbi:ABC transporter substrate-binding protein [Anaerotardibacter muris]|uniref:ABC transporter substrate-binding protein n=1 Tax=Anaerotardibacter muris TaxID=2941505 RepID=UPI002042377B|nr:ABC transporter substrate-binding protein [Anaerotardibacter muris]
MKKLISLVMAAAMLTFAFVLAGCQSGSSEQSDDLSVWVKETDYRDYIEDVFELYESETGNKLNVKTIPDDSFTAEVTKAFKEGNGPDVLLHYNDSNLAAIGADKFLTLNDQAWADSITAGARAYCDDGNGNLVGLPFWESSVSGCYYNKTILSSLGLKPASTQAEFDMLCQALKNIGYNPLFWGEDCGWMYQFGLDPIFADDPSLLQRLNDGQIDYADIPQVHDMVQWIDSAYKNGWLGDVKNKGYDNVSAPLASGDAVMVDIWDTWFETDFQAGTYGPDDFAVMPVFMGTSPEGSYEGGNLNMMLVNKDAKHLDEAIEFLEFCAQPEVYNEVFEGVPSVKVFNDQDTIVTSDMVVAASSSIAKLERASTANPKISGYSQEDMITAFTALFNGEVDVDGCIAMMDELRHSAMDQAQ